jgi:hypothetical protein
MTVAYFHVVKFPGDENLNSAKSLHLRRIFEVTSSMELCSREVNSFSATQEIPSFLRIPKVYYRVHKSPPVVPIFSQTNSIHNPPPISLISKIRF